ncbi:MAG: MOSC domain-containing protein [Galactobacter sp.]
MPHVSALYRYPIKGFTPEPVAELTVQEDGRIAGDRVLAFRFANATEPENQDGLDYWPKSKGLALMTFPSLARLRVGFDGETLTVSDNGEVIVAAGLDPVGRREVSDAVADWVLAGPDARRLSRPGQLPLVLVGDGHTSRFQDRARGFVSLHACASVDAVAGRVPGVPVDSRRFRSNIVVDGLPAWQELEWAESGTEIRVGNVALTAQKTIVRCKAIEANPDTGRRDADLLGALTNDLGQPEPTLGTLFLPRASGGIIRVGDEVTAA